MNEPEPLPVNEPEPPGPPPEAEAAPVAPVPPVAPVEMGEPAPSIALPQCWRCGQTVRAGVRFCGHCGMALSPDDFLKPTPAPPRSALGLGLALATYFVLLAGLVAMMIAQIGSMRTLLLFDVAFLSGGVVLFLMFWHELGTLLGVPARVDGTTILVSLGALGVIFGLVEGLAALFPELFADLMQGYRAEGESLAFALFQVGPLTALGEELLFRGVILTSLRRTFPDRAAIGVSAAMFATIHLSPVAFLHTGGLGLLFAWLVVRTGSLWPSILLHSSWNMVMVLLDA